MNQNNIEIERKFLLANELWRPLVRESSEYLQGYLPAVAGLTLRARVAGGQGFFTLKGPRENYSRLEFEFPIPASEARAIIGKLCGSRVVHKIRHLIDYEGKTWEVDEYLDENSGLFTAEIELQSESETFALPSWLGMEVSRDVRYTNGYLAGIPFAKWKLPPKTEPTTNE